MCNLIFRAADVSDGPAPNTGYVFTMAGEHDAMDDDSLAGMVNAVKATEEARQNPGSEELYDEVRDRYDPSHFEEGTIVARLYPDGEVEWPRKLPHPTSLGHD